MENPKLTQLIESNERVLFADRIKKFRANCFYKQERIIVITTCKLYNIKKTKVQRQILIKDLAGISKALLGTKAEFTVHVKNNYDYRYLSEKRSEILGILKYRYADYMNENLPIYGIQSERTNLFHTLEKDFKRGVSKFPPKHFRIECENVIVGSRPSVASTRVSDTSSDAQLDLQQNVEFRQ